MDSRVPLHARGCEDRPADLHSQPPENSGALDSSCAPEAWRTKQMTGVPSFRGRESLTPMCLHSWDRQQIGAPSLCDTVQSLTSMHPQHWEQESVDQGSSEECRQVKGSHCAPKAGSHDQPGHTYNLKPDGNQPQRYYTYFV